MSPISSPSIEVSTDSIESEKVWRPCRFGQNLPLSERIQPENLFPFTSVQWTPTAAETNGRRRQRKQATDGKVRRKRQNSI